MAIHLASSPNPWEIHEVRVVDERKEKTLKLHHHEKLSKEKNEVLDVLKENESKFQKIIINEKKVKFANKRKGGYL